MKKIFLLGALLLLTPVFSQSDAENSGLKIRPIFRVYTFYPMQFGDHSLAEAHQAKMGVGFNLSLFSYEGFRLMGGADFVKYRVTDFSKIGNIKDSNYDTAYVAVSYDLPLNDKICFYPTLGYGAAAIHQRTNGYEFGDQNGNEYRAGVTADYRLSRSWAVVAGLHFIHTQLDINTSPEFKDFFGQANQVQLSFGIQLR